MKIKKTPYSHLYYLFTANLPLTGGHREYFGKIWERLDLIIQENYDLKEGKNK
jgi:hypothetical protein